jgi:hypothetical protein
LTLYYQVFIFAVTIFLKQKKGDFTMYRKVQIGREFVRFEKEGDSVEGYIDRLEQTSVLGKDAERVVLLGEDGLEIFLPSNFQINEFGRKVLNEYGTGVRVKIEYKGERRIKGGRTLKLFDFYVDTDDIMQTNKEEQVF